MTKPTGRLICDIIIIRVFTNRKTKSEFVDPEGG